MGRLPSVSVGPKGRDRPRAYRFHASESAHCRCTSLEVAVTGTLIPLPKARSRYSVVCPKLTAVLARGPARPCTSIGRRSGDFLPSAPRQGEKTAASQHHTRESRTHGRSRNSGKASGGKATAAGATNRARTDLRCSDISITISREDACYICPSPTGISHAELDLGR